MPTAVPRAHPSVCHEGVLNAPPLERAAPFSCDSTRRRGLVRVGGGDFARCDPGCLPSSRLALDAVGTGHPRLWAASLLFCGERRWVEGGSARHSSLRETLEVCRVPHPGSGKKTTPPLRSSYVDRPTAKHGQGVIHSRFGTCLEDRLSRKKRKRNGNGTFGVRSYAILHLLR
jgi:hypothetical protein